MDTKLTLRLDEKVIERAKNYAHDHKISLSRMIESYLDSVTKPKSEDIVITPLVESLSGVMELPADYDFRKDHTDFLLEKYK